MSLCEPRIRTNGFISPVKLQFRAVSTVVIWRSGSPSRKIIALKLQFTGIAHFASRFFHPILQADYIRLSKYKSRSSLILALARHISFIMSIPTDKEKRPIAFFDITISDKPVGRVVFSLFNDLVPKTVENFRKC